MHVLRDLTQNLMGWLTTTMHHVNHLPRFSKLLTYQTTQLPFSIKGKPNNLSITSWLGIILILLRTTWSKNIITPRTRNIYILFYLSLWNVVYIMGARLGTRAYMSSWFSLSFYRNSRLILVFCEFWILIELRLVFDVILLIVQS